MEKKQREQKVKDLDKWLNDFDNENSPYADVNLIGESEDYVRGYKDGIALD